MKNSGFLYKNILPEPQKLLWDELNQIPEYFNLYGGTAIALYLGHRQSIDFDFFSDRDFDPDDLFSRIAFLEGATVVRKENNTLTVYVDRGGSVKVSFLGLPDIPRLGASYYVEENSIRIANMLDLAGTKSAVVQKRSESKDYIDIDAILSSGTVNLPAALAAGRALYGSRFNPEITLKALCYFDDGDLKDLPLDLKKRLVEAVRNVDPGNLPDIFPEVKK